MFEHMFWIYSHPDEDVKKGCPDIMPSFEGERTGNEAACFWILLWGTILIKQSANPSVSSTAFNRINLYMLIIMLIISGVKLS